MHAALPSLLLKVLIISHLSARGIVEGHILMALIVIIDF